MLETKIMSPARPGSQGKASRAKGTRTLRTHFFPDFGASSFVNEIYKFIFSPEG